MAIPLGDLQARFVRRESGDRVIRYVETLAEAHGVMFLCPKCFAVNGGPAGTHQVRCWFVGMVPDDADPKPGRWNPSGAGLSDLTFVPPGQTSVLLLGGCGWHGHIVNGAAVDCP